MRMSTIPIDRTFLDIRTPEVNSNFEFTVDCGAVYFGVVYDGEGMLRNVDQYFYTEDFSRDDMEDALDTNDLMFVDTNDFPCKAYLLTKEAVEGDWVRFHAVVPNQIDPDYYYQKYIGD
ncbi:MAG: hypothetical protein H6Q73_1063 [Firmicutes bacterium]|nr:hypothetical protein [Bacillota bacterium]